MVRKPPKKAWWEIMARMPIISAPDLTTEQVQRLKTELALERRTQKRREDHDVFLVRSEAKPL